MTRIPPPKSVKFTRSRFDGTSMNLWTSTFAKSWKTFLAIIQSRSNFHSCEVVRGVCTSWYGRTACRSARGDRGLLVDRHRARGVRCTSASRGSRRLMLIWRDDQTSSGDNPVCLPMRASMRGPISSPSWKAKTKSGHPGLCSVRCEPDCRLTFQPMRRSAARTRRALAAGNPLIQPR